MKNIIKPQLITKKKTKTNLAINNIVDKKNNRIAT